MASQDPTRGRAESEQVVADHRRYVLSPWSTTDVNPFAIETAEGCAVYDFDGRRYLDLSSQMVFTNIGHQHPSVVAAIREQASLLCTVAPQHANAARSEAARMIADLAPGDLERVFFTTAGTEAVEHAVRMARVHTGRYKVLSAYRSYHGATSLSIHLTGDARRWASDTASAGVVHFFGPFPYRSPFGSSSPEEEAQRALEHLEMVVEMEGPQTLAALVLETVPGTSGILPPPPGYLSGVREICDRHGICYIADEVMCGFGRTGAWFATEHWDVVPDLITFAKGVTSGYVPLGGVIMSPAVSATFDARPYPGGLTYSGHPLACATAVATMTAMCQERMVEHAAEIGREALGPGLDELARRHPCVGEVRGLGVFFALDLVRDPATREPLAPYGGTSEAMGALVGACMEHGVLPFTSHNRLHVVPPCTISPAEVTEALGALDAALSVADHYVVSG